jgi:hypothetical protein
LEIECKHPHAISKSTGKTQIVLKKYSNNSDFELRYRLFETKNSATCQLVKMKERSVGMLTIWPELPSESISSEFIFIIDRSGSMSGSPIKSGIFKSNNPHLPSF